MTDRMEDALLQVKVEYEDCLDALKELGPYYAPKRVSEEDYKAIMNRAYGHLVQLAVFMQSVEDERERCRCPENYRLWGEAHWYKDEAQRLYDRQKED